MEPETQAALSCNHCIAVSYERMVKHAFTLSIVPYTKHLHQVRLGPETGTISQPDHFVGEQLGCSSRVVSGEWRVARPKSVEGSVECSTGWHWHLLGYALADYCSEEIVNLQRVAGLKV